MHNVWTCPGKIGVGLLAVFATLTCVAASPTSSSTLPSLELEACARADLPDGARCGVMRVAEDPRRQPVREIELRVIVLPARTRQPLEPVLYLPGGPGQSAADMAARFVTSWITEEHPLLLMDPRGTDPHTGLDCPAEGGRFDHEIVPIFTEGEDFWRTCRDNLKKRADLTRYTTPLIVEDYDALRRLLGYEKIDLFGGSFGTRFAMAYIHVHGDHVRAALLTGVSAFSNRSPLYHAEAAQRAFDHLVAECEAEPACRAAFPVVRQDLTQVLERLRSQPTVVPFTDEKTQRRMEVLLTASAAAEAIREMMYDSATARRLPIMLRTAITTGDLTEFARLAWMNERDFRSELRVGLLASVTCPEDVARIRREEVPSAVAGSFIGDSRVRGQIGACAVWPKGYLPKNYFAPFRSSVATVFVSGEFDPVTPPKWADEARKSFPNSLHLVTRGAHARVSHCIAGIAAQVFRTGSMEGVETQCVADETVTPFVLVPNGG